MSATDPREQDSFLDVLEEHLLFVVVGACALVLICCSCVLICLCTRKSKKADAKAEEAVQLPDEEAPAAGKEEKEEELEPDAQATESETTGLAGLQHQSEDTTPGDEEAAEEQQGPSTAAEPVTVETLDPPQRGVWLCCAPSGKEPGEERVAP